MVIPSVIVKLYLTNELYLDPIVLYLACLPM